MDQLIDQLSECWEGQPRRNFSYVLKELLDNVSQREIITRLELERERNRQIHQERVRQYQETKRLQLSLLSDEDYD